MTIKQAVSSLRRAPAGAVLTFTCALQPPLSQACRTRTFLLMNRNPPSAAARAVLVPFQHPTADVPESESTQSQRRRRTQMDRYCSTPAACSALGVSHGSMVRILCGAQAPRPVSRPSALPNVCIGPRTSAGG
ncbi:hypothetical protein HYPSUDRAFT_36176 [Hypholoma sublateritium FD-334 SS-4]|uniref:Uncharacterized protein n=1 Tax=Hypholoma sublateritium (strain FD-334 SS-4) TaxID=945553 RepID=A0A0D2LFR2_HYPSF|nr:hypothetical protein HYPSUDRAFT_36176 [Hypholoma sublateritium FD-334 SS-4]